MPTDLIAPIEEGKDEQKEIFSIGSTFDEWDKMSTLEIDLEGMDNPFK